MSRLSPFFPPSDLLNRAPTHFSSINSSYSVYVPRCPFLKKARMNNHAPGSGGKPPPCIQGGLLSPGTWYDAPSGPVGTKKIHLSRAKGPPAADDKKPGADASKLGAGKDASGNSSKASEK